MSRITNKMMTNNYLSDMQINLKSLSKVQNQMSSGKTINKGSDDPSVAARLTQLNSEISANKQYNSNITDTTNWLDTTDTALSEAGNVLSRIRELMVKAGNGAYDTDERKAIKKEAIADVQQLTQTLNTSFDGSYIFGGTKSTSKPVTVDSSGNISYADKDGNALPCTASGATITSGTRTITNMGKNGTNVTFEITDSSTTPATVSTSTVSTLTGGVPDTDATLKTKFEGATWSGAGNDLFSSYTSVKQIGSDLISQISDGVTVNYNKTANGILEFHDNTLNKDIDTKDVLSKIISDMGKAAKEVSTTTDAEQATALTDINGDDLKQLDSIISNLLQTRSSVGTLQNRMDSAKTTNEDQNYNMTSILSSSGDIDLTEKTVEYSSIQTVYTAALQTSSKVLEKTLLDYI